MELEPIAVRLREIRRDAMRRKREQHHAATNPNFKLKKNMRCRVYAALKGNIKSARTKDLLGCDIDFLWDHLESQFTEGMTRENYGEWHVDHIVPCSVFNLEDPIEQRICFHYSNLAPLWAADNVRKYNSVRSEDIDAIRERLTPEITARIEAQAIENENKEKERLEKERLQRMQLEMSPQEKEAQRLKEKELKYLRQKELKRLRDLKNPVTFDNEKARNKSKQLKAYYATEEGKANNILARQKVSETKRIKREQVRAEIVSKVCFTCKVEKPKAYFNTKAAAKDGLQTNCIECVNVIKREWRANKRNTTDLTIDPQLADEISACYDLLFPQA